MLIVREIFKAKPGQASKLARLFKSGFGKGSNVRVMTDIVGDYNTVVIEMEVSNLDEFEKYLEDYKSGKDPEMVKEMQSYTEMYINGRREIFKVLD